MKFATGGSRRCYLLAHLIRCPLCGQGYIGMIWGHSPKYLCLGRTRWKQVFGPEGTPCPAPPLPAEEIEERTWQKVTALALDARGTIARSVQRRDDRQRRTAGLTEVSDGIRLALA